METARLIIYDTDWNEVGVIDAYTSLIWTKRYTSCGDFELHLPFQKRYLTFLKMNYFVTMDDTRRFNNKDYKYAMIIERIEINQSAEDGVKLSVKGRSLLSILYRRVIYSELTKGASKFNFISEVISGCLNGANLRKLGAGLGDGYAVFDHTIDKTKRVRSAEKNVNLGEFVTEFCESTGTGIDIMYNAGTYEINVYEFESKENSVIFSSDLNNLANCSYIEDISGFANTARVSGDFSGNQYTATVPQGEDGNIAKNTGLNRYETAFTTNISNADHIWNALQAHGILRLRKYSTSNEITAEIINTDTYGYEIDYRVGDIVKIITDFGITAVAQLKEMTESWGTDGYRLTPVFSNYKILETEEE